MKTMEFGHGHLTGQPYARCECGWTCVYWEDEIDLIHECEHRSSCCNAPETWLDCDQHPNDECYATRCDECWNITYRDCEENNGDLA